MPRHASPLSLPLLATVLVVGTVMLFQARCSGSSDGSGSKHSVDCGDGILQQEETCESYGNGWQGCSSDKVCKNCQCVSPCGNGQLDSANGEECDYTVIGGGVCSDSKICDGTCHCIVPSCGDSIVTPPEECEAAHPGCENGGQCVTSTCMCTSPGDPCGNGQLDDGEDCDPMAVGGQCHDETEVCTTECVCMEPDCGDGIITRPAEQCEPNPVGGITDGCPPDQKCDSNCECQIDTARLCGNGFKEMWEDCDPSTGINSCHGSGQCGLDCTCGPKCGNGLQDLDEECDFKANPSGCDINQTCVFCNCVNEPVACGDSKFAAGQEECDWVGSGIDLTQIGCLTSEFCDGSCHCQAATTCPAAPVTARVSFLPGLIDPLCDFDWPDFTHLKFGSLLDLDLSYDSGSTNYTLPPLTDFGLGGGAVPAFSGQINGEDACIFTTPTPTMTLDKRLFTCSFGPALYPSGMAEYDIYCNNASCVGCPDMTCQFTMEGKGIWFRGSPF